MDVLTVRRAAPLVYVIAVVVAAFVHGALVPVAVVGALLVGLVYTLTARTVAQRGLGRDRHRDRRR